MPDNFIELASASKSAQIDATALAAALKRGLQGEVRFDDGSRALYATDGSNYRQVPIGVVVPRDVDDAVAAVALAREFGAPILCRGGGTAWPGSAAMSPSCSIFRSTWGRFLKSMPPAVWRGFSPGVILDHLRNAAEKHHLTFGPDPRPTTTAPSAG